MGSYSKNLDHMKFRFYKFYDLTSGESDTTILDYHTSVERIEHHIFETPSGTKYSMVGFKVFLQFMFQVFVMTGLFITVRSPAWTQWMSAMVSSFMVGTHLTKSLIT